MTTLKHRNKKRIAVVTSDQNKVELIDWAYSHKEVLTDHEVVATEATGTILEGVLNTPVNKLTGLMSGHQQLAGMLSEGKLDIMIFLSDPAEHAGHGKEEKALLDLAVNGNIIIAANRATADLVLEALRKNPDHFKQVAQIADRSAYVNPIVAYIA